MDELSVHRRGRTVTAARPSYYVTSVSGAALLLLLGPFPTAPAARTWVDDVESTLLTRGELHAALDVRITRLIGTAKVSRPGDLNACMGLVV